MLTWHPHMPGRMGAHVLPAPLVACMYASRRLRASHTAKQQTPQQLCTLNSAPQPVPQGQASVFAALMV